MTKLSEMTAERAARKRANDRAYAIANRDKIKQRQREWAIRNKERLKLKMAKYYAANRERLNSANKAYYIKHKPRLMRLQQEYLRKKYYSDPTYRLSRRLRCAVNRIVAYGYQGQERTMTLLGCTWQEARQHLEAQFKDGMSWDNYGPRGWHIDHIRPVSSFDYSDPEQAKAAFHYTNLQPMWAADNIRKGAKWAA